MTSTPPKVSKNPPPLQPGMDNPWYDYAPFPKRPKLAWPKNARVAFFVVLPLEYYELLPAEDSIRDSRFVGTSSSRISRCAFPTPASGCR